MGKKLIHQVSSSSAKICKDTDHKKQLNSLINVLKPKVYITDSSNFKKLVQELTGNPISFNLPPPALPPVHQEPFNFQIPIINQNSNDHDQAFSFDSSIDSSEASFPTSSSFATTVSAESSPDINASSDTLFLDHILESSSLFVNNTKKFDFPACEDIESWLLEIDNYSFNYDDLIQDCLPGIQQAEVSVCGFDYFSDLDHLI